MPHRLTALPVLPEPLAPLGPLAHGLAAEWDDGLAGLFRALAPDSGATAPLALLAAATPERLAELAADEGYVEAVAAAVARESERLGAEAWYATLPGDRPRAIAYFSPEFGVSDALPQYSGGLGMLAGDHLKAATDLGVPIVGGRPLLPQRLLPPAPDARRARSGDVRRARSRGAADAPCRRRRRRARRHQRAAARRDAARRRLAGRRRPRAAATCSTPTCRRTRPAERAVTDRLYGGDSEHRLRQEILLGIGGVKALAACGVEPAGVPHERGPRRVPRARARARLVEDGPATRARARRSCARARCSRPTRPCPPASTASRTTSWRATSARAACRPACRSSACSRSAPSPAATRRLQHGRARHPHGRARERRQPPARRGRRARCSRRSGPGSPPTTCRSRTSRTASTPRPGSGRSSRALYRARLGDGYGARSDGWERSRESPTTSSSRRARDARAAARRRGAPAAARDRRASAATIRAGSARASPACSTRTRSRSASRAACPPTSG